jgi:predicted alpha/beta hydrolase family esterase
MKKTQILFIHGGMTFKNQKDYLVHLKTKKISFEKKQYWIDDLEKKLGKKFQVVRPRMPLQDNARYRDWEVVFSRYVRLLSHRFILIGTSLGGVFLAKYLSEHTLRQKAAAVFLVCPPFDNSLPGEDLVGGFALKSDLSVIEKNARVVYALFSKKDDVVPVAHAKKYSAKLPNSRIIVYPRIKGHFEISKFPEIITLIRKTIKGTPPMKGIAR